VPVQGKKAWQHADYRPSCMDCAVGSSAQSQTSHRQSHSLVEDDEPRMDLEDAYQACQATLEGSDNGGPMYDQDHAELIAKTRATQQQLQLPAKIEASSARSTLEVLG